MKIFKQVLTLILLLTTSTLFAQFPEGFESTVPPPGWVKYAGANGLGTAQEWNAGIIANSGAQAAYAKYENVTGGLAQDWLVTPQFTPTPASNLLTFMQRQSYTTNYGSVYKVFISTGSQTTHSDFTLVDTQDETDFTYFYTIKEIDISAYVGVPIYVAFVLEQDDGDNWLIDDVALTASASCTSPDNLSASNFGLDFATVSWSETGSAINWQIEYGISGFIPGTGIILSSLDTSLNLVSLSPTSNYDFYVAALCAPGDTSAWTGPFSFSTLAAPLVPDYLNDFANFPGQYWSEASGPLLTGPTGTVSSWESDYYINTPGDTSAKVNLYFFNSNHWLISPDFDLSGGSYELNLYAAVTDWNVSTPSNMGSDDQVDLLISTDYGVSWISLYQWNTSNTPSNNGTPIPTVNLSTYTGTVRFALLASDGISDDLEDYDFYIDDFSITAIATPCTNTSNDIVTACDNYTWIDGVTYTVSNNIATHVLINAAGCDSTVTLDLTLNNSNTNVDVITACDNYTWINGVTYTVSNNIATHLLINSTGCDSTVTLDLTINNGNSATDLITACDNYTWINGVTYNVSNNIATHLLTNATGCDSTVSLDLTINNSNSATDVITACDNYTWIDGVTYTVSNNIATHLLTNASGCDSTVTLDLTINNSNSATDVITACDDFTWIDGVTYTASNNSATHVLTNSAGCDSTVTLDLTINNSNTGVDVITACDSYTWIDGITYTVSNNSAMHTITGPTGCQTVITLNLTINNSNTGLDVITACDSYIWINGVTYTFSNNIATHLLTNAAGCDSTVTLDLTLNNSNTSVDVITACDNYTWINGVTYTVSNNIATHLLTNATGCDSIVTLDLTINNSNSATDVITACDNYTWIDGVTYTVSNNIATHVLTNATGCDSIVTLDLTINNSNSATDVITACDNYTWIDGVTYTVSNNSANHVLTNATGCDSTVTLDLTINNSNASVDVITACDNYTWIDSVTYTASNNIATHVLTNATGCDSIVTLDLTINNSNSATDVITACDNYTWIDGLTYTVSNNIATHVLTNATGCDSIVTLDLTINNSNSATDVITACDNYTWIDGVTYTVSNNIATHVLTNAAGCDSTVTIDLTINNSNTATDVITACDNYTWIDGVTYTVSNNSATHVLTNAAGCDSTVSLDLTINTVNTTVSQVGTALTANETGATYQWLNCPAMTPINGATNQTYTATVNGDYAVVIDKNGCSETSTCYNVTSVGLQNSSNTNNVIISPNPTSHSFKISFDKTQAMKYTLHSITGKVIFEGETQRSSMSFDLSNESKGVYFLRIGTQNDFKVYRVIKQ